MNERLVHAIFDRVDRLVHSNYRTLSAEERDALLGMLAEHYSTLAGPEDETCYVVQPAQSGPVPPWATGQPIGYVNIYNDNGRPYFGGVMSTFEAAAETYAGDETDTVAYCVPIWTPLPVDIVHTPIGAETTPEPVAQEPVGYVNFYKDEMLGGYCFHSEALAKKHVCPNATRTAIPLYTTPPPPPDTVSREEHEAAVAALEKKYQACYEDYEYLRESYDNLRAEAQPVDMAEWERELKGFLGDFGDAWFHCGRYSIVDPRFKEAERRYYAANKAILAHVRKLYPQAAPDHIVDANKMIAVAPKGVIPFVKNLEQLLRVEKRDALADQVAKLRNCIVELPEPEDYLYVKPSGCIDTNPDGDEYVATPDDALQIAANAVKAAALLAAAEQKEGE